MGKISGQIIIGLILAGLTGISGYGILNWYANLRFTQANRVIEKQEHNLNYKLNPALNRKLQEDQQLAKQAEIEINNDQR